MIYLFTNRQGLFDYLYVYFVHKLVYEGCVAFVLSAHCVQNASFLIVSCLAGLTGKYIVRLLLVSLRTQLLIASEFIEKNDLGSWKVLQVKSVIVLSYYLLSDQLLNRKHYV